MPDVQTGHGTFENEIQCPHKCSENMNQSENDAGNFPAQNEERSLACDQ